MVNHPKLIILINYPKFGFLSYPSKFLVPTPCFSQTKILFLILSHSQIWNPQLAPSPRLLPHRIITSTSLLIPWISIFFSLFIFSFTFYIFTRIKCFKGKKLAIDHECDETVRVRRTWKKSNLQKWNAVCKRRKWKRRERFFTGENCMHGNWQWLKLMPNEVLLSPTILTLAMCLRVPRAVF